MSTMRARIQRTRDRAHDAWNRALGWATIGMGDSDVTRRPPPADSHWSVFRGSSSTFLATSAAYTAIFMLTSGAPGSRMSLLYWLFGSTSNGERLKYFCVAVLVAGSGSLLVRLLSNAPISFGRRWFNYALWPYLAGSAFVLGCSVQMRLRNDPGDAATPAATLLLGMIVLGPLVLVGLDRLPRRSRLLVGTGWGIALVASVLRFGLPSVAGNVAQGAVFDFNAGEISRAMMVVAIALMLTGGTRQAVSHAQGRLGWRSLTTALLVRLWPALLYLALLVLANDMGPIIVLTFVMGALTLSVFPTRTFHRSFWAFLTVVGGALGLGLVFRNYLALPVLGDSLQKVAARFSEGGCAQGELTQACQSQRILHQVGLLPNVDPNWSPLTRRLFAAESDYAPTVVGSVVGLLLLVVLLSSVIAVGARLWTAAQGAAESSDDAALAKRLALGGATAVLVSAVYLSLAILLPRLADLNSSFPLTGLDLPLLAANGGSSLQYGFLLSVTVMALRRIASEEDLPRGTASLKSGRAVAVLSGAVCLMLAVSAVWISYVPAGSAFSAGSERLATEALLRDTAGRIITTDGLEFSRPADPAVDADTTADMRFYPHPQWAVDLGFLRPTASVNLAVGIEYLAAPLLTCGQHRAGPVDGTLAECKPRDVVTTVNGRLQQAAQEEAGAIASGFTDTTTADIVVIERRTGAIRALASSTSRNPAMQDIVTGRDTTWIPRGMTGDRSTWDAETYQRNIRLYALAMLSPANTVCVEPPDEQQEDDLLYSSRADCAVDLATLQIMHAWRYSGPPGSTFKPITGLAAQFAETGLPLSSLGHTLTSVNGTEVVPPLNNRGTLVCPAETLQAMIAYSCNTTAGWFGVAAGEEALLQSAQALGFRATETQRAAGTVSGPADPSSPDQTTAALYYNTNELGLPENADVDPSTLARTAIGQAGVRAGILDLAGVAAAIADKETPSMTLIEGTCTPRQDFESVLRQGNSGTPLDAQTQRLLEPIVQGMESAVKAGGTAASMGSHSTVLAKTGTADDAENYQRWVMAVTPHYVVAARVGPIPEGRTSEKNPAVILAENVIDTINGLTDANGALGDPASACTLPGHKAGVPDAASPAG